ncbi:MAG: glycolate oxidase subunit GlcE [Methyloligellaceae bacterium]
MSDVLRPSDEQELAAAISEAAASETPLEIYGGGTKRNVGRPLQTGAVLTTEALTGVTLYEPNELVIAARAGTPLSEIEAALAQNGQRLAFEPIDLAPALGGDAGVGTIGAVFATNLSGSRRILAGAARDSLLGTRAVNGQGEVFKSGGRVMKNVTGYDLCRGLAGSWGTLAVMSEVTMKVLPKAEETRTLVLSGLTDAMAVEAMCVAMGTPYEVSGTVHLQAPFAAALGDQALSEAGVPVTALRLENFSPSVAYRADRLKAVMGAFGTLIELDHARSQAFWAEIGRLKFLQGTEGDVWRLSIAPKLGSELVAAIAAHLDCRAAYDWSGGLIWLEVAPSADAGATEIRRAVAEIGGYATLIRAEPSVRASVDVFQALEPGVAAITKRLKAAFDPGGILNPGRMYPGV